MKLANFGRIPSHLEEDVVVDLVALASPGLQLTPQQLLDVVEAVLQRRRDGRACPAAGAELELFSGAR